MNVRKWVSYLVIGVCLPVCAWAQEPIGAWTELPRRLHATDEGQLVVLDDGRVMQLGGFAGDVFAPPPLTPAPTTDDCEIFDPSHPDGWHPCAPMLEPRAMFWAVKLPSGNVLVAGNFVPGYTSDPFTSSVYVTEKDRWVAIADTGPAPEKAPIVPHQLVNPHSIMTPVILDDGSALIAGGGYGAPDGIGLGFSAGSYRFVEDPDHPRNGRWERVGDLPGGAVSAAFTKLSDGRVLFAGGLDDFEFGTFVTTAQAAIYDPGTRTWQALPDMPACVGTDVSPWWNVGGPDCAPLGSAAYDSACGGNAVNPGSRWHPAVAALPGGDAIVAGGSTWGALSDDWWSYARASVVRFDGRTNTWQEVTPMTNWRQMARAVPLPFGFVLVNGGHETPAAEIYDPWHDRWLDAGGYSDLPSCADGGWPDCYLLDEFGGQLRKLKDGRVLQTCGYDYDKYLEYPAIGCDRAFVWSLWGDPD